MLAVISPLLCITLLAAPDSQVSAAPSRWKLEVDGPRIVWDVAADERLPHQDHLEMAGRRVAVVARYGVAEDGSLSLERTVLWPMLRTVPNDTHASLRRDFGAEVDSGILVDGAPAGVERPQRIVFDGLLEIESALGDQLTLQRTLFPDPERAIVFEEFVLRNAGDVARTVEVVAHREVETTDPAKGVTGAFTIESVAGGAGPRELAPGESLSWTLAIHAREGGDAPTWKVGAPEAARRAMVRRLLHDSLRLETPEPELDAAFAFAKLRAAESIFATKGGLMHAPGGTRYYAAIWANDTVEYVAPFYPFLGDPGGNEASWNALRHFARFMNPDYEMLPSSIIAEGDDVWMGARDRGDAAMVAYGGSLFLLALGDRAVAEELWPLVEWSLEYCARRETTDGVIASDRDELEGRLPHGKTNLSTSMLTYGGLVGAARLARSLGKPVAIAEEYERRAVELRSAVERFFGAEVEGFETYRYHEGNDVLRSWICVPLTMGVFERRQGTLDALFSERLWTPDGLKSIATDETFWDRSTLYGLRGAFAAGDTERALGYFRDYTRRRLVGEHVPYAVEAWPEGNQRHLSAESALYARVVTEGLFGIEPLALDAFRCTPRLPAAWDRMALRGIRAFGAKFDLLVRREGDEIELEVRVGTELLQKHRGVPGTPFAMRVPAHLRREGTTPVPEPFDVTPPDARPLTDVEMALASQEWGTLRRNRSVSGVPLRVGGRMFTRGVGTHAESEITLLHDGSPARLSGSVGVDDGAADGASVEFLVGTGDGILWRSGVMRRGEAARPFDVPLHRLHVVTLHVTAAGDGNSYDHADWLDLRLSPVPPTGAAFPDGRLSVVDFGALPDSGDDATAAVHAALASARHDEPVTLEFPPGRYDFHAENAVLHRWFISNHDDGEAKRVSIPLCGFRDLTIEGEGAELVFHGQLLPLAISDCERITVRGLSIDFARPHHSQAEVLASSEVSVTLGIGPEYPYEVREGRLYFLDGERSSPAWEWSSMEFERDTGRIAYRTGDARFRGRVEELSPGRVRVHEPAHVPAVGNVLVLRHGGRPHPGVFLQRSADVRFKDVVVHQAEGMGFLAQRSSDVSIVGGGVHLKKGTKRVFTTSADATHFSNCSGLIRVENALFEGMMDDAINVHGTYLQVQAIEEGGVVRAQFKHGQSIGFEFALPGENVQAVRRNTLLPYAALRVGGVRKLSDNEVLLRFTGGPPPGMQAGDGLENLDATPEVIFRKNIVRNNRARGALFSSPRRTVVEDNLFDHSSGSAILLAGDCNGWFESGACRDVLIRGNRFVNCLTSLYQFTEAVISISPEIPALDAQERPYHANVVIENNEFTVFDRPLLFARSVENLRFVNNRIILSYEFEPFHRNQERFLLQNCPEAVIDGDE